MNKLKFVWLLALVGIIFSLVIAASTVVLADWNPGDPYKMHFPQMPNEAGWDVNATVPIVLADDWGCIESGWVKDIHFWGSWMHGIDGIVDSFALSIHANIPEPPDSSTPGETLQDWITSAFIVVPFTSPTPEGWYDPPAGQFFFEDHMTYYQYNIFLPESLWFWQEEGTIYWLNISAFVHDPYETQWGWKSSTEHWMDDAVWAFWGELNWIPMYEPPYFEMTLDLAFVITGDTLGPVEDLDFGDCPDPNYPTLLASDGARHIIVAGVFLGASIDPELNGQPDPNALGDDNDGNDDEDGVVFTSLVIQGNPATVKVTASVGGLLDAWVDFNGDGDWADPGEQIFASRALVAGVNVLTFNVPAGAQVGTTYSRFRFNTGGAALSYTGQASDGEVEDYRVFILKPVENIKMHWPQLPDLDNTGMDVDMHYFPLADDWECTETGSVTDIHFWGSFADDILPADGVGGLTFQLTIHSNIPAPPHSMPGDTLWTRVFHPGEYLVYQIADNNPEDWYDPATGLWINDDHLQIYQYEFYITDEPFVQEAGTIYWLEIKDIPPPEDYTFGWKTTPYDLHFMDDATWLCDPPTWWCPLTYPPGHEWELMTVDLAFVITGKPCEPPLPPTDLGCVATDTCIVLTWTNTSEYDSVAVYRSWGGLPAGLLTILPDNPESYHDTSCGCTGNYDYHVTGFHCDEESDSSNTCWVYKLGEVQYSWDFNESDQGWMHYPDPPIPPNQDSWQWGPAAWPHDPGEPTCPVAGVGDPVPLTNYWGTIIGGPYLSFSCCRLFSPPVQLDTCTALLEICHWYAMIPEPPDGGNVKVSTDDGETWELITPCQGYPFILDTECDKTMFRPGYSAASPGWVLDYFDLAALGYGGKTVRIAFDFGSNENIEEWPGWYIKWAKIYHCPAVGVDRRHGALEHPTTFELAQNYPNPFNLQTAIRYQIPEDCRVSLEIYNLLGQKVRILVSADQKANYYTAYWDGRNTEGKEISSGIYFYTLRAGNFTQTRRMVILK